jgi:hypothetical protein
MAKEVHVNQAGTVKKVLTLHVNQAGVVKPIKEGYINQAGVVRQFYASAGPPAAPQNLRSTNATASTVALAWDAAVNNGFPVTAYRVEWGTDGVAFPFSANLGNVLVYTATGLTSGTEYFFRVRATNSAGDGPWSSTLSQETVAGPPLTPTASIVAASTTATSVVMRVTVNASGPLPTHYDTNFRENKGTNSSSTWSGGQVFAYSTTPQNLTLTGLEQNVAYEFRVKARNASGSSVYVTGMFMVTSLSGSGQSGATVTVALDPEDVGAYTDRGRGLNSVSEGGGGQTFGSGNLNSINGKTIERYARSGNTTFTIWLLGNPSQTQFSKITLFTSSGNGNARTLLTSQATFGLGGLTGTVGIWTWSGVDISMDTGQTWTNQINF